MRLLGTKKNGIKLYATDKEIIDNALMQEKEGIKPHYSYRGLTPNGWLVWMLKDGCGVVYRRNDGKLIINEGKQGDFVYN